MLRCSPPIPPQILKQSGSLITVVPPGRGGSSNPAHPVRYQREQVGIQNGRRSIRTKLPSPGSVLLPRRVRLLLAEGSSADEGRRQNRVWPATVGVALWCHQRTEASLADLPAY